MDIKALFFWTFKDNYEWHRGNTIKFGLFDDDDVPRSSAHLYAWLIKNFQKVLQNHSEPDFILQKWHEILNFCEDKINKNHFKQFYDAALMSDKKN